jgi:mannose-6-phosphate isomerase-like protein (cupin superfamily)
MKRTSIAIAALAAVLTISGVRVNGQSDAAAPGLRGVRTKAEIDAIVAGLRSGALKGPQALFREPDGAYRVYTSYIDHRKGVADIHINDDEVFVILSGLATCTLGGDIQNKTIGSDDHDFHGNTIVGGTTKTVAEGDIVSAPHGTAHQMDPGDGHILYIVIKIIRKP